MLVTKREVKTTSKKALSLLLAVLMVMTSMSVCFGTFTAGAANIGSDFSGYTADAFEYLAQHLNGATVKKYTDKFNIGNTKATGSANSTNNVEYITDIKTDTYEEYCELRDILIYIDKAVKATECYQVGTADTNDEQTKSCVSAGDVEAEILDGMGGYATPSAAAKEFLAYVLEDSKAVQHNKASTSNKSPAKHTATLNVYTEDYKGYLEAHSKGNYSTVDSSIEMGFTYSMYMKGGLYYSVKTTCGSDKYYHNALWPNDYPINAPSVISGKSNTAVMTTLKAYADYFNDFLTKNTFDSMAIKSTEAIDALKKEFADKTTTIKNYIADAGEGKQDDLYNKLFPGYVAKVSTFNTNAEDAKAIAVYSGVANDIAAYQSANSAYGTFNWGSFDEATIKADYADFTRDYASLLNNATVYNYFVSQNVFSGDYINNFRDNTVAYDLEDLKLDKIEPLYNKYALSFPMEGGEELPLSEKQVAYSELSGYINNVRSYTAQVQNAIFPETLNHLLDLQEKLECQVAGCVVYFAENVNKDYTDVATADVIKEVGTAKAQLAALNALANSIDYAENAVLLDGAFDNAETFIDYLYSLLAERYTAQVEIVDETYTAIGRPKSNLTIKQYSQLNAYVNGIEQNIVEFLDAEGYGSLVTSATRAKYTAIQTELMPAFKAFEADRGFTNFKAEDVLIRREDNSDELFRQNADLDGDGVGEYEVTDENVENIINLLNAALKDPTVTKLLGDMINKDADGNPTGEAFSLSGLINGLLEDVVYTDSLINTIVQFVYPLVLKEFAKVWAGLPPTIDITVPDVIGSTDALVKCGLGLDDVETAIQSVGLYIAPTTLAANLNKVYGDKYKAAADVLSTITQKAKYDKATDTFRNPWENVGLFEDVIDETTGEPVLNDDGTVKQAYKLEWGVDKATDKKEAFLDAAVAALSGLEPLLMAIISNKHFTNPDVTDGDVRGIRIGYGSGTATVGEGFLSITVKVDIEPITLTLDFKENDGWDNALAPIFEALGLKNIPHSEDLQTTRKLLENGLFAMIDQLVSQLDENPVEFLLNALPNLAYMIEAGMIEPLLHELKTVINYYADAYYDASVTTGTMKDAMKSEEPININIGEMINLKDMGLDISNFKAIWNMLSGVELLKGLEAPDAAYIASLGELVPAKTNRSVRTYTATTSNGKTLKADEAWYVKADKAAVLEYLVQWVLESGLLSGLVAEPSELITTIFSNLENNSGDAIAAIVELLNQKAYPAKEYEWFDGTVKGESVVGNSAMEIYMNPNNDWTKEKAEYLYENLDTLLNAVLEMAGVDFDLGATISGAVDGILTDKTLTALANLLAKLDINALLNEGKTEEELAKALDVNALINQYLGLDLAAVASEYADIATAVEANPEYVHNFGVDAGEKTFAEVLSGMLEPLNKVLDFILNEGKLTITIGDEKVELLGADGYNNAIVPLLEALGCKVEADPENTLKATINAIVARVDALTQGDVIKNIINLLPGVLYFISSNGLSTAVLNLLQPVLVIVDTIRPVFDVMELINGLEFGSEDDKKALAEILGGELDLENLNFDFIFNLLPNFIDLDLSGLKAVIYDICNNVGVEYTSVSTLIEENGKKGAYTDDFNQADLLTVVLSFVLEWATIADNAAKLDEMLGTDGLIANIGKVFEDVEIKYGTPTWYYWFDSEEAFDAYINGEEDLPNTLEALTYPNNWTKETADYFEANFAKVADEVISAIAIGGVEYESVSALLNSLISGYINADTINMILDLIKDLLANVDDALLSAGYILDVDVVGLKNYTCTKEITTIGEFAKELAYILDTYAKGLVDLLFFGDDFRIAKKSDKTDTIVINGGLGYEKSLALILEALGCDEPAAEEATVYNVLESLADRVEAILADPVNEILDLLPNLVYFLNANGASVAVDNLLQPVYALLDKLAVLGVELDIAELIGFDLKALSLNDILTLVEDMAGIDLTEAKEILVDLCFGKIEKLDYTYKMVADKASVITVIATIAVLTIADSKNAEVIEKLLGAEAYGVITNFLQMKNVPVQEFNWAFTDKADTDAVFSAFDDSKLYEDYNYGILFTKERADYIADNFADFVNNTIYLLGLDVDGDGKVEKDLTTLINDLLGGSLYNSDIIISIRDALAGVLANITELEVSGIVVGSIIADVLKTADIADINAVADVKVPEFKDDKEAFVAALCDVLEPLYGVLKYLLADKDFAFFVKDGKNLITLNGAEGYAYGIIPLLETLGCKDIVAPADYYAAIESGNNDVLLTSILNPLLNRVDEIIANPADEILEILPNLIYFINSNGVDTVVKNTLNAVYTLLAAIEPIAKVDLYSLIGLDLATLNFNKIFEMVLDIVAEKTGYEFENLTIDALAELSIGKLEKYTSLNGKEAYRMVYAEGESGTMTEMVVTIEKLLVTFVMHENNRAMLMGLLKDNLGMSDEAAKYVDAILDIIAEYAVNTADGMDSTLYLIYTVYYVADTGVENTAGGLKDLNASWKEVLDEIRKTDSSAGAIIDEIFGWDIFEDVFDSEEGLAPNGLIKFFQKIADWFRGIGEWFKKLFSFGK